MDRLKEYVELEEEYQNAHLHSSMDRLKVRFNDLMR